MTGAFGAIDVVKADGTTEVFDENKLIQSLTRAGASKDAVEKVLARV